MKKDRQSLQKVPAMKMNSPLGALKCNTFPSSLNMLTSSTPVIGCTFSFFSAPCSFLSSCAFAGFDLRTIFRRTVPFPPVHARWRISTDTNQTHKKHETRGAPPTPASVRLDVPILFEAACACSLASFAGSIVRFVWDLGLCWLVVGEKTRFRGGNQILVNKYIFGETL